MTGILCCANPDYESNETSNDGRWLFGGIKWLRGEIEFTRNCPVMFNSEGMEYSVGLLLCIFNQNN